MQHFSFINNLTPQRFRKERINNLTPKLFRKERKNEDVNDSSSKTLIEYDTEPKIPFKESCMSLSVGELWRDVMMCKRCDKVYPKSIFHCCEIYGNTTCPDCIPAHFCLAFSLQDEASAHDELFTELLFSRFGSLLRCHSDASNNHCILVGFRKQDVELIQSELVKIRDDDRGFAAQYGLRGMEIEYVPGI
jgi:hypothetical protein